MTWVRRTLFAAIVGGVAALSAASPAPAFTTTMYVNGATGDDTNACTTPEAACKTIRRALGRAATEVSAEAVTIDVSAGLYVETLQFAGFDGDVTVEGAGSGPGGTEIEAPEHTSSATVEFITDHAPAALSDVSVVNDRPESENPGIFVASPTTLTNVNVTMTNAKNAAIHVSGSGDLQMRGGVVTMSADQTAFAIGLSGASRASLEGITVETTGEPTNGAIVGGPASELTLSGSSLDVVNPKTGRPAIEMLEGKLSLSDDRIAVNGAFNEDAAIIAKRANVIASGVSVAMANEESSAPAIEQSEGDGVWEGLSVTGAWRGVALEAIGGNVSVNDSTLETGATSTAEAINFLGEGATPGLVVTRSMLRVPTSAFAAIFSIGNITLDSSEILGGNVALHARAVEARGRRVAVAASTLDPGLPGVEDGHGVELTAEGASIDALIEGSIVLAPQEATLGAGLYRTATITCLDSDVPSQSMAETGSTGSIECASGNNGNSHSEPATLFVSPFTGYELAPTSPAVDAFPAAAITLPFGLTPSSTDLSGKPRAVDGNGDCAALEDQGALELQGHAAVCPLPPPRPLLPAAEVPGTLNRQPALGALTLSPSTFSAAARGATMSKRSGTKVSYADSEAATTTFTVLVKSAGRTQGHSCKKPSKHNKHGKRCTLYLALGTFTHADAKGADSFHFSGRLKGRKLATGSYKLVAVASNANGKSAPATTTFRIK